ncbi:MAG: thioredoxin [Acidobacteriota bacterium]
MNSNVVHLLRCKACGSVNRVPADRLKQKFIPICGRCATALSLGAEPVMVNHSNFAEVVEQSAIPVVVDFWADWCAPCKMLAPVLDQLASELDGRVQIAKLNIDENQAMAVRFNVRSIPTLIIFKDGKAVDRLIGLMSKEQIMSRLEAVLEN